MNTDALISELSKDVRPVPRGSLRQRLRNGLVGGAAAALALVVLLPSLGVRADLDTAAASAPFWVKLLYTASITVLGFLLLERLSRPGAGRPPWGRLLAPPVLALAAITAAGQVALAPGDLAGFWMGSSALQCLLFVSLLAVPVFAGLAWAMSQLAPTQLRAAGAAAGLVAGSTSATVYALHCAETSPGFVLLWYSLALAGATLLGAAVGPRLLRW